MNDFARPPGRNCSSSMTRRTGRRGRATRLPQALWKGSTGIPRSTEDCTGHSAPTCGRCRSCGAGGHGVRREQEPSEEDTTCWGGRLPGHRGAGAGAGARSRGGVARSGAEWRGGTSRSTRVAGPRTPARVHLHAAPSGDRSKLPPPCTRTCRERRHVRTKGAVQAEASQQGGGGGRTGLQPAAVRPRPPCYDGTKLFPLERA